MRCCPCRLTLFASLVPTAPRVPVFLFVRPPPPPTLRQVPHSRLRQLLSQTFLAPAVRSRVCFSSAVLLFSVQSLPRNSLTFSFSRLSLLLYSLSVCSCFLSFRKCFIALPRFFFWPYFRAPSPSPLDLLWPRLYFILVSASRASSALFSHCVSPSRPSCSKPNFFPVPLAFGFRPCCTAGWVAFSIFSLSSCSYFFLWLLVFDSFCFLLSGDLYGILHGFEALTSWTPWLALCCPVSRVCSSFCNSFFWLS